jgi:hypothetical protein
MRHLLRGYLGPLVLCILFLAACGFPEVAIERRPTPECDVTAMATTLTTQAARQTVPTLAPAPLPPTPTLPLAATPPPLLYIHQGRLIEQVASGAPQHLTDLPDAGAVLDGRRTDDVVLVLREQGLQRAVLTDGSVDLLLHFDVPARFGALMADGDQVIYQVTVDDPLAEFSMGTHIGLYDSESGAIRATLYFAWNMCVLGLTADGSGLYLLPRGQDPGFAHVLEVSLPVGEITADLSIEGTGGAMLSPDGCYLITTDERGDLPEGTLNIYALGEQTVVSSKVILLPNAPSHSWGWAWSADGRFLYFVLMSGAWFSDERTSYGLWRLEVKTGMLSQVVPGEPGQEPWVTISSGGGWMLLRHSGTEMGALINLETNVVEKVMLPPSAIPTSETWDWQPPSFLSVSREWLLLRYLKDDKSAYEDTATLVHLPTAESRSFVLPAAAVVVGWR